MTRIKCGYIARRRRTKMRLFPCLISEEELAYRLSFILPVRSQEKLFL